MNRPSIVLLLSASCLWIGCGRKSTTVTGPDGSKATVTQKGDGTEITITGDKGKTVRVAGSESGVALPEGFPKDVPVYAGAKVTTSMKSEDITTVVLTTTDPAKKVMDFYGEKLKANGWDIKTTMNTEEGGMVMATKGKSTCTVYIGRGDKQTTISLGVAVTKE